MKRIDRLLAAVALGLAVSYPLAPSVAQQAPPMSRAREQAIRECSAEARKYVEHTWGDVEFPDLSLLHGTIRPKGVTWGFLRR
jgi:hypothetical protein